ncbi:unnamed protein product [Closterium sp. NIES-64]|nr:unnamed protein product [Closterium sp. NIES-64]
MSACIKFGVNVCGEGGEYETLTLDCPLFKHARIVVDSSHIILHSPDPVAPVGVLRITAFHVARKTQDGAAAAPADAAAVPADAAAADVALPPPVIIDANDEDALNEDDNGTAVVPARGAAGRDSAEGGEGGKGDGVRVAVTVQRHGFTLIACDTEGHDANDLASHLSIALSSISHTLRSLSLSLSWAHAFSTCTSTALTRRTFPFIRL